MNENHRAWKSRHQIAQGYIRCGSDLDHYFTNPTLQTARHPNHYTEAEGEKRMHMGNF